MTESGFAQGKENPFEAREFALASHLIDWAVAAAPDERLAGVIKGG